MPSRPRTPEAGALTASAEAAVDGHGHQFGQGVDQSDYASPPAFRLVGRAARHASVTRRATSYESRSQLVSPAGQHSSPSPGPLRDSTWNG